MLIMWSWKCKTYREKYSVQKGDMLYVCWKNGHGMCECLQIMWLICVWYGMNNHDSDIYDMY